MTHVSTGTQSRLFHAEITQRILVGPRPEFKRLVYSNSRKRGLQVP